MLSTARIHGRSVTEAATPMNCRNHADRSACASTDALAQLLETLRIWPERPADPRIEGAWHDFRIARRCAQSSSPRSSIGVISGLTDTASIINRHSTNYAWGDGGGASYESLSGSRDVDNYIG